MITAVTIYISRTLLSEREKSTGREEPHARHSIIGRHKNDRREREWQMTVTVTDEWREEKHDTSNKSKVMGRKSIEKK